MNNGYAATILKIDLSGGGISRLPTEPYAERFMGGRGLAARLYWELVPPGTAAFDPYERDVRFATTDVAYETRDFSATFGTFHGLGGELQFIRGELRARLSPRWAVRVASNYDLLTSTVVENRLEVEFREQCWAITAAFIDRTNEDAFHITINLLELGQYGFGQAFGAQ